MYFMIYWLLADVHMLARYSQMYVSMLMLAQYSPSRVDLSLLFKTLFILILFLGVLGAQPVGLGFGTTGRLVQVQHRPQNRMWTAKGGRQCPLKQGTEPLSLLYIYWSCVQICILELNKIKIFFFFFSQL